MEQKPSLGRIVHFVEDDAGEPFAAVITKVWSETCVNLQVFGLGPQHAWPTSVSYSPVPTGGLRWFWPPRV